MNDKQVNIQNCNDEIDIRELAVTLWKQKFFIISITLICAILIGLYSVFILSPVYDTKLNIVISIPETYKTRYGEYKLPITTNQQYIDLILSNDVIINTMKDMGYSSEDPTIEDMKSAISIDKANVTAGIVQNSFNVTVSADNPEESLKLAETLYKNFIEFLDVMLKERIARHYSNDFSIQLKLLEVSLMSSKEILQKNKELLTKTPQTINQKEAMKEIQGQLTNTSEYVVLENVINPNYTKIESDIIESEQEIISIENSMNIFKGHIEELENELTAIAKYYETGKTEKLESNLISIVETSVYLPSPPVAPTQKTSPSNAKNVVIGAVLGVMAGAMIVLVKYYWFSAIKQGIEGEVIGQK